MKFPAAFERWIGSLAGRSSRPVPPKRRYQRDHWGAHRGRFVVPDLERARDPHVPTQYKKWIGFGDFQQLNLEWVRAHRQTNHKAYQMYADSLAQALESFHHSEGRAIVLAGPAHLHSHRYELAVTDALLDASYFPDDRVIALAPVYHRFALAELTADEVELQGGSVRYVHGQLQRQLFGVSAMLDMILINGLDARLAINPLWIHCSGNEFPDARIPAQVMYRGALKPNGLLVMLIEVHDLQTVKRYFDGSGLELITQKNTADLIVSDSHIEEVVEEPEESGYMLLAFRKQQ